MTGPLLLFVMCCAALAEALALLVVLRLRPTALLTENYRGITVVGRAGATLAAPLAAGTAMALVLQRGAWPSSGSLHLFAAIAATGIFGLLGWLDDAYGTPDVRGMKGHLIHLVKHRRLTTGLLKAVGGAVVGIWAAYLLGAPGWTVLPAGAVIALSANSTNMLDTRPGRAAKAFAAVALLLVVLGMHSRPWSATPPIVAAALLGGILVFGVADLAERVMLGDTGANALGCALGLAVVVRTNWPTWIALALLLFAFCLAADRWSMTRIVESVPGLRWVDELGRLHSSPLRKTDEN